MTIIQGIKTYNISKTALDQMPTGRKSAGEKRGKESSDSKNQKDKPFAEILKNKISNH